MYCRRFGTIVSPKSWPAPAGQNAKTRRCPVGARTPQQSAKALSNDLSFAAPMHLLGVAFYPAARQARLRGRASRSALSRKGAKPLRGGDLDGQTNIHVLEGPWPRTSVALDGGQARDFPGLGPRPGTLKEKYEIPPRHPVRLEGGPAVSIFCC